MTVKLRIVVFITLLSGLIGFAGLQNIDSLVKATSLVRVES